jgi:hypothetical protein
LPELRSDIESDLISYIEGENVGNGIYDCIY